MKVLKVLLVVVTLIFLITVTGFCKHAKSKSDFKHSVPMEGQTCVSCHESDKQYAEWEKSAHGLILVKCEVCHGDESAFRKKPADYICRECHPNEFENKPIGVRCISCHAPHTFKVKGHNIQQKEVNQ